ncbi:MAG: hypothetical protein R3B09_29790 [Nannocystaceae bacterium]
MRARPLASTLVLLLAACTDGGGETDSDAASDSATGTVGATTTTTASSLSGGESETGTSAGSVSASATGTTGVTSTTDGTSASTSESTSVGTTSVGTTGTTEPTSTTDPTEGTTDGMTTGGPVCGPPPDTVDDVLPNAACEIDLQQGTFTPVVEWKWGSSPFCGPPVAGQTIDSNNSGEIDSADLPVIYLYQSGTVVALWGDGSGVAWQKAGSYGADGGFALGDLDGDGWSELITANATTVCALDARDGTEKWCTPGLAASLDTYGYSYPAVADMDGDGFAEVIAGNTILDHTGVILGKGAFGKGAAPYGGQMNASTYGAVSAVTDLDGDGVQEVVTGNAAYDLDGLTIWQNGGLDGLVAVADFDGDGEGEIVKTSGIHVRGMESDGTEVWGPITYGGNLGVPAIDDLDGDDVPEIVLGAQNKLVAMEWGGQVIWTATIADNSGAAGPVLFDFEMDGYPEVLYADETTIRFFSGLDGSVKFTSNAHKSYTILETPIVADVDGDHQVEIVLGHCSADANIGAITIYGDQDKSWPPGRKIWNQHTYHITNVADFGGVPAKYQSNWLGKGAFNSFRSADVGQQPGEYHDLQAEIVSVCEEECEDGTFYMAARIRNGGTLEVPAGIPVTVRAGLGGPIVVTQDTTQPVPPGKTGEILWFAFEAKKLAQSQPVITVDDTGFGEGTIFECDEMNNTAVWPEEVCPTVMPG